MEEQPVWSMQIFNALREWERAWEEFDIETAHGRTFHAPDILVYNKGVVDGAESEGKASSGITGD
jgi:hypothetical protein